MMSITATGMVFILISVAVFIMRKRYLYDLSIFTIPFSATAIINTDTGFWLTPFHYFAFLWMSSFALFGFSGRNNKSPFVVKLSIVFLLMFGIAVVISIFMSDFYAHDIEIRSYRIWINEYHPLELTSRNITTVIYLLFGVLYSICIYMYNDSDEKIHRTVNVILASLVFVCVWGGVQFFSNIYGFEYPYEIFNNTGNELGQGYKQILSNGLMRVSSVSTEPSMFAQFVVAALTMLVFLNNTRKGFIKKLNSNLLIILSIILLFLSTSTTAYVGLFFLFILYAFYLISQSRESKSVLFTLIVGVVTLILTFIFNKNLSNLFVTIVIDKFLSGSGQERFMTIKFAYEYFLSSPIFGLGWGSVTSHDLIFNLLANTGIFGAGLFLISISIIMFGLFGILNGIKKIRFPLNIQIYFGHALLASLVIVLLMQTLTGFIYYQGLVWFVLGMSLAIYRVIYNSSNNAGSNIVVEYN